MGCPICVDPGTCKAYSRIHENLRRPDGHRWIAIHHYLNSDNPAYAASMMKPTGDTEEDRRLQEHLYKHGCGGCP